MNKLWIRDRCVLSSLWWHQHQPQSQSLAPEPTPMPRSDNHDNVDYGRGVGVGQTNYVLIVFPPPQVWRACCELATLGHGGEEGTQMQRTYTLQV